MVANGYMHGFKRKRNFGFVSKWPLIIASTKFDFSIELLHLIREAIISHNFKISKSVAHENYFFFSFWYTLYLYISLDQRDNTL